MILPDTLLVSCLVRKQEAYQAYEQHFKDSPPAVLRDCLELVSGLDPISIDEVHVQSLLHPNQINAPKQPARAEGMHESIAGMHIPVSFKNGAVSQLSSCVNSRRVFCRLSPLRTS